MANQLEVFEQQVRDSSGRAVLQTAALIELPPGRVLYRQGDRCCQYLLMVAGRARVYLTCPSGRELVLYRLQAGQACVLTTSCLLGESAYPASCVSDSLLQALVIPRPALLRGLAESEDLRLLVMSQFGQRLQEVMALISELSLRRLDIRLARLLLERAHPQAWLVSLANLANSLDAPESAVNHLLHEFEQRGWILLNQGSLDVQQPLALNRYIAEATL